MRKSTLILSVLLAATHFLFVQPVLAEMRMWVGIDDLQRRTCPSTKCGVVGRFFFGESVYVFQAMNGWSRVSHFKSAGCYEGESMYVEAGRSVCSKDNGISQGEFAEWVKSEFLVDKRPGSPLDAHG